MPNTAYLEDNRQDEEDETLNGLVGGVVSTVGRREGSDAEGEGAGRGTVTDCVEDGGGQTTQGCQHPRDTYCTHYYSPPT